MVETVMPECFCRASRLTIGNLRRSGTWIPATPCPRSGGALGESVRE